MRLKNNLSTALPLVVFTLTGCFSSFDSIVPKPQPKPIPAAPAMPEATQEGKNTFGCRVNGNEWVARFMYPHSTVLGNFIGGMFCFDCTGIDTVTRPVSAAIYPLRYNDSTHQTTYQVSIQGLLIDDYRKIEQDIRITTEMEQLNTGTYVLTNQFRNRASFGDQNSHCFTAQPGVFSPVDSVGYLQITHLDQGARIIAGTFAFSFPQHDSCQAVIVTDGRFDIAYSTR